MDTELCTIYCGNLSSKVTEELLYELFLQAGPLRTVKIPKTLQGESKLYGFVEYQHECSVDYAIQLFHHTTLFGQELQLKRRKQNNVGQLPTRQISGMHRTSSLPVMMNIPMQAPPLFYRPPFIRGFMHPEISNMLNYGLAMTPVVPLPCHIRFNEDGSQTRNSVQIPAILDGQHNYPAIPSHQTTDHGANGRRHNSTHKEGGGSKRRNSSNSSSSNNRQEYEREGKKTRYSHLDKHENHQERQVYKGSEDRPSASCKDLRETRDLRRHDHRSSRRDHTEIYEDRRHHRWEEHHRSRSHHDRHQESRSSRDRPVTRNRHYID